MWHNLLILWDDSLFFRINLVVALVGGVLLILGK